MTVYLPRGCTTWWYDFRYEGRRYLGSTKQIRKDDAQLVESRIKLRVRQEAGGIATFDPKETPRFQDWAEITLAHQKQFIRRPELFARNLDVVLEFCGAKPTTPKKAPAVPRSHTVTAPYHDLRLGDFIADPSWLTKFDAWIERRHVSGSTRNSYLSAMSTLYRLALSTGANRQLTHIPRNPFVELRRSPRRPRVIALEPGVIQAWIAAAPYHIALAATIAALAPKLRLNTILQLEWAKHFDRETTRIRIDQHKTAASGVPQITPLSAQLQAILKAERKRSTHARVITYHGKPVASIKKGTRRAAESIGLTWGLQDGVTFHTIRHSIATLLADLGLAERLRMELLGHREMRTTQQYTHLAAKSQIDPHEQLSRALPLQRTLQRKAKQTRSRPSEKSSMDRRAKASKPQQTARRLTKGKRRRSAA